MFGQTFLRFAVIPGIVFFVTSVTSLASIVRNREKIYIVDQSGEHWDITQAASIGIEPQHFHYGIGRDAIKPLDDPCLSNNALFVSKNQRVIGIVSDSVAQAYSVPRLSFHGIANSTIGSRPIGVVY